MPLVLLVQVKFQGGRPWTFYPEATDYIETLDTNLGSGGLINFGVSAVPFQDADGLSPPWLKPWRGPGKSRQMMEPSSHPSISPLAEVDLERRFSLVPWILPRHPEILVGLETLTGIGLEWRSGPAAGWTGFTDPPRPSTCQERRFGTMLGKWEAP